MLFELRNSTPEVSPAWTEARDLFLGGRSRQAWTVACALRGAAGLQTANDYILNVEIARACGAHATYMALVRKALAAFPHDPIVRLYQARVLLTRGRHTAGIEFLLKCEGTLGKSHRAWWGTELANVYASAGFDASCRKWLDAVRSDPEIESPLALYTQACACEGMRQWDEAIAIARRCVAAAPAWTRARAYLANCLLARGKVAEAEEEIAAAQRLGHEEAMLDMSAAGLALSLGRFPTARAALEAILENWPQADSLDWVRRTLCILLVELGDYDAARQVAGGREAAYGLPPLPETGGGKHCFIPLPPVAQHKNQCVPTSVAMATYPQGHRFDSDVLFREMCGRDGTSLWRMRHWVEEHRFRLVPIRLEWEGIVALLDRQVPLIGTIEGPFNSHVEVVCGYNEVLQTIYIRDPMHWAPQAWPLELALARYALYHGLMAIIPAVREDVVAIAEQYWSDECAALIDLPQAVAQGDLASAESAHARIPDGSAAAFLRDMYGLHVTVSRLQFRDRMRRLAEDDTANPVARFRALMYVGSQDTGAELRKLLEADSNRFGPGVRRYLKLLGSMSEGRWNDARTLVERLLLTGGGISHFWELKSDILAELGEQEASREALELAIELEPLRMSLREKSLNRSATQLTYSQYLEEFDSLLSQDPDDKRLLWGRAAALQDGPDGKAYERAAREVIRWFPRHPSSYWDLVCWYRLQARGDLADAVLEEASRLLPDVFEPAQPPADTASTPEEAAKPAEVTEPAGMESLASPSAESPTLGEALAAEGQAVLPAQPDLPEEKEAILNLVWSPADPRRPAALARALELQQDGQLHWYESARLLACRLLMPDEPGGSLLDPEQLLPERPPGAVHWFARTLCDVLTDSEPSIRTSLAVLAWLDRIIPDLRGYVDLWFLRVLLLEQARQVERALDELRALLERYPATSSALYRMGVVKYQQQDLPAAQRYLEQALDVNPGLIGAMDVLRKVHEWMGQPERVLQYTLTLRRKLPYSFDYLRDEVLSRAERESVAAAEAVLDEVAADFPPRRLVILRARILIFAERLEEAAELLPRLEVSADEEENFYEDYLQVRLAIALRKQDSEQVVAICQEGLRRWPHSTRLKEIQAGQVAEKDPQLSRSLLREVLIDGEPSLQTAQQYLGSVEGNIIAEACEVVLAAAEDKRLQLAELFGEVMGQTDFVRYNASYLEWALGQFPESDMLRWRLANHFNLTGYPAKAIELARELQRRNPDSPEALRVLGRCLTDSNAEEALPYLEKACGLNRSVDNLFDLARCYQALGETSRSQSLHWEILEQNPFMACSWTSLYVFGADHERLWPFVGPMLERGYGVGDEYFLVATVMLAVERRATLPQTWFPLAVERHVALHTHPGYRDERPRLAKALLAWLAVRPADGKGITGLPRNPIQWLVARYWWPRRSWIPRS